jgi:hypothetical protein
MYSAFVHAYVDEYINIVCALQFHVQYLLTNTLWSLLTRTHTCTCTCIIMHVHVPPQ